MEDLKQLFKTGKLLKFLEDVSNLDIESWSTEDIEVPFDIKSEDFLKYAETDLSSQYEHKYVNALSNVKRSLDCQLDSLLFSFGLFRLSKRKNFDFPKKLEILNLIGVISPQILRKINKQRNLLEHQYKKPKGNKVIDALDVAHLFVLYASKFMKRIKEVDLIIKRFKLNIFINFDYTNDRIVMSEDYRYKKKMIINADENVFLEYLKRLIRIEEKCLR